MGTKAVFQVKEYPEKIIGMLNDGFPGNLEWIATELWKTAKELRVLTKWKAGDKETIKKVMDRLIVKSNDFLFLDNPQAPEWVSYSASMSIKNRTVTVYDGYEDQTFKYQKLVSV